jgi:RNA polymerase sigma-70 factor (ECF subfamily)
VPGAEVPAQFRAIIEENYVRIYNLLLRLVGDREAAADLVQDTFVRAYQAWPFFRGDSQVSTWLYRIAVNLARNYLERRARERRWAAPAGDEVAAPLGQLPDPAGGPEQALTNEELRRLLYAELARLRPEHREIVVLRDVQGLSYEEIAQILGCSVQAVKSKLFRARSALRRRLAPYLGWEA